MASSTESSIMHMLMCLETGESQLVAGSRIVLKTRDRTLAVILVAVVSACRPVARAAPAPDPARSPECLAELAREHETGIHETNMPHRGDSLVFVVNGREAWRGVYDPCVRADLHPPKVDAAVQVTAADSVALLEVLRGPDVAERFHVGGAHVTVIVIGTVPKHE